jgi:hypothetical protein
MLFLFRREFRWVLDSIMLVVGFDDFLGTLNQSDRSAVQSVPDQSYLFCESLQIISGQF